ncbi:NYN domain-containing protein [Achromobacter sp.]|uniref:NYN domain-containing protein n=1 Tax=Achromobacter sp. TaxID=134375 RepID=UPI0028A7954C|nr:NYN domain-containing protein [Achromobacter sp.]
MNNPNENVSMALFCDFENVALGVRDTKYQKFDIRPVLERLLLKGSIVVKKAYCDWERYKEFKAPMHEANFELIEIPHVRLSGKNSADIRLVVDALDFCYTKSHVNTFVIISGDSDFSPLVSKLRENNKKVIGVGVKQSTSDLLIANCDEFIFYDDLAREGQRSADARRDNRGGAAAQRRSPDEERRRKEELEARKTQAVEMVVETFEALMAERGDSGKIWASALKDALKRRKPDFNESYYGFRAFGNLLEEAQSRGFMDVGREEKSGTYVYRDSTDDAPAARGDVAQAASARQPAAEAAETQSGAAREGSGRGTRKSRGGRKTSGRGAGQHADGSMRDDNGPSSDAAAEGASDTVVAAPSDRAAQPEAWKPVDAPQQTDAPKQPEVPAPAGGREQAAAAAAPAVAKPAAVSKPVPPPPQSALVSGPPPKVNVAEWTFVVPPAERANDRPAKPSDPFAGAAAPSQPAEPAPAAPGPKRGRAASKTAAAKPAEGGSGKSPRAASGRSAAKTAVPEPAAAPADAETPAKPARKTARKTAARKPKPAADES